MRPRIGFSSMTSTAFFEKVLRHFKVQYERTNMIKHEIQLISRNHYSELPRLKNLHSSYRKHSMVATERWPRWITQAHRRSLSQCIQLEQFRACMFDGNEYGFCKCKSVAQELVYRQISACMKLRLIIIAESVDRTSPIIYKYECK